MPDSTRLAHRKYRKLHVGYSRNCNKMSAVRVLNGKQRFIQILFIFCVRGEKLCAYDDVMCCGNIFIKIYFRYLWRECFPSDPESVQHHQ